MLTRIKSHWGTFYCDTERDWRFIRDLKTAEGHQGTDLSLLCALVRDGDIVCDIGAHIGTFTVPLAHAVGQSGKVHSFEVCADTFAALKKNVEINNVRERVKTYNCALSDNEKPLAINTTNERGGTYLTSNEDGAVTPTTIDLWAHRHGISHIDIIKIDTEGMECRILTGASNILQRDKPILYFEINRRRLAGHGDSILGLERLLRKYGYHFFRTVRSGNKYTFERLLTLYQGGSFSNAFAVHKHSHRYLERYISIISSVPASFLYYAKKYALKPFIKRAQQK